MNQPLDVTGGGVTSLSDIQRDVAAAVAQLAGSAPDPAATEAAYGTISSAFTTAMGELLPHRDATLQAASTSGTTIAELLERAAQRYAEGDEQGAATLRAAAEVLGGHDAAGAPGGAPAGGTGAVVGADPANQMASQVGQQVGQVVQGIAQSVQGLAQGLTQLPQQIMQGVQGAMGSDAVKTAEKRRFDEDPEARTHDEDEKAERAEDQRAQRHTPPAPMPTSTPTSTPAGTSGAQPGHTGGGQAPLPPPAPERPRPAQTRPQ